MTGGVTRIVGIGASAGGLDPLLAFFAQVPPTGGMAYVVVQHLDPTHKALLGELLQRATVLPVRQVTARMPLHGDAVYVIPPNTELTVASGRFQLAAPGEPRGLRLPVDVLFCSLARDQGDRAIGVVLSGMGADGTLGLQAIKSQGGLTLAQQPASAAFPSMPASAIKAGTVDIVALPADLPGRILAVTAGQPAGAMPLVRPATDDPEDALQRILGLLLAHGKRDLTLYKPSTVRRRIERRMAIHGIAGMDRYAAYLEVNGAEVELLFREMLIGVTSFFRDREVWDALRDLVLPELFGRSAPGTQFRAWVAGCSTGEEAFSLAMVFQEALAAWPDPRAFSLQVFATDLNVDAIAFARRGRYAAATVAALASGRRSRFFRPDGGDYLIDAATRAMVLFAQHDVNMDPPFTRLDLLSCRNLLIYFSATLQKRVLPLFHYSLRPGGVLILGESETIGTVPGLFRPLAGRARLYVRSEAAARAGGVHFPVHPPTLTRPGAEDSSMSQAPPTTVNLQAFADQLLLQRHCPPAVLVSEAGDILYINGRTGTYLEPAAGKANWNIHAMVLPELRAPLAAAMRQAVAERTSVTVAGLPLAGIRTHVLDLTVEALDAPAALERLVMILLREVPVPAGRRPRQKAAAGLADASLGTALLRSQEEIGTLHAAMRTAEEERQAAIEELQSTNEELQSANEELTTSKEEAQSMNEELQTINAELRSKLDDLALAQSDMQNLLNSTDIATLFLDKDLQVRRFTEQIKRIIHLRDADVGRPLSDLASTLSYPGFGADVLATLRTLAFSEKEVATNDGHWFKVRIMPYRTVANVIQGAVVTFVDITAAKELEARLRNP